MNILESGNPQEAEAAKFAAQMLEKKTAKALEEISFNVQAIKEGREFLRTQAEGREDLANRLDAIIELAQSNPTKDGATDILDGLATRIAATKDIYLSPQGRFNNRTASPEQKQAASESLAELVGEAESFFGLK